MGHVSIYFAALASAGLLSGLTASPAYAQSACAQARQMRALAAQERGTSASLSGVQSQAQAHYQAAQAYDAAASRYDAICRSASSSSSYGNYGSGVSSGNAQADAYGKALELGANLLRNYLDAQARKEA